MWLRFNEKIPPGAMSLRRASRQAQGHYLRRHRPQLFHIVGDDRQQRRPCRHILLQLHRIDLVERVVGRVVVVEIAGAVLVEVGAGNSRFDPGTEVRPGLDFAGAAIDSEREERSGDPVGERLIGRSEAGLEAPHPVGPEVALGDEHDLLVLVGGEIGLASGASGFLVAEPDDPDRPARPAPIHHPPGRRGDDRDSRSVVDRSGAEIPAVEMAADEDHARFGVGPRNLRDDVAGRLVAEEARGQGQVHHHLLLALQDALEVLGVGDAEGGRGDGLHIAPVGESGMGVAVIVGAERADDDGGRALLSRDRGRRAPHRPVIAIARPVLIGLHRVADEDDPAAHRLGRSRFQLVDAVEADHFGGEPLRYGGAASAQGGEDEPLRERRDDLGRLGASYPGRHRRHLDMDVPETKRPELAHRPRPGPGLGLGSGQPWPHFRRQPLDDVVGDLVLQRRVAQPIGLVGILGESGKGEGGGRKQQGLFHDAGRSHSAIPAKAGNPMLSSGQRAARSSRRLEHSISSEGTKARRHDVERRDCPFAG
jgi:hypothetical protein